MIGGLEEEYLRYTERMKDAKRSFLGRIEAKVGQVLFVVSQGRDMTKLEIKKESGLSMSTVLSAVDDLRKEGLLTLETKKSANGGKPHSVINIARNKAVYGVSYKARTLTAAALGLSGEVLLSRERYVSDPALSPTRYVEEILTDLRRAAPPPIAIALAVNSAETAALAESLAKKYDARTFPTGNVAALAYHCLWRTGETPLAVLGIGNRIKCASLRESCLVTEVGGLRCPVATTRSGNAYERILALSTVEERLRAARYRGVYALDGDRLRESMEIGEYARTLARAIASLAEEAYAFLAPRRLFLYGDYLTDGFFERVRSESRAPVERLRAEKEDFAVGAALLALAEGVFKR